MAESTFVMIILQCFWGLILLLLGIVLRGVRADITTYAADVKQLTAMVLGQCVQKNACEMYGHEKWDAISDLRKKVQSIEVDLATVKAKFTRSD